MKNSRLIAIAVMLLLIAPNVARSEQIGDSNLSKNQTAVTNQDVIAMLKAGLSADIVAAKIRTSECQCDTSPAGLEQLKSAGVPDNVILAMVEASKPKPDPPKGIADIRDAKTVYLLNQSTDFKVFNELPEKLGNWGRWKLVDRPEDADVVLVLAESKGRWKLVDRPEDADVVLVLAESNMALGAMSTASASTVGGYSSGTGMAIPLMSFNRFLIAFDRATHRELLAVDHQRTMAASYTAGALVNRMRKEVESPRKTVASEPKGASQ